MRPATVKYTMRRFERTGGGFSFPGGLEVMEVMIEERP